MTLRIIEVVDYNPNWVNEFEKEKALILSQFSREGVQVHSQPFNLLHIGSTSVVGLSAKPIIDMLLEVDSLESLDLDSDKLAAIGYQVKGEYGIKGRRYFQRGEIERTHQIHAFLKGSDHAIRHLAFRDYLTAFPEVAKTYAEIKKEGAKRYSHSIDQYCEHKNDFVVKHEAEALIWFKNREGKPC